MRKPAGAIFLLLLAGATGCNRGAAPESVTIPSGSAPIDSARTGSIEGTVALAGGAPPRIPIRMDQDPACGKTSALSESLIVNAGKLQNVFVYVRQGAEQYRVQIPKQPAVLDQLGCLYQPHVLGMVAGQTLRIQNSDNTEHNVHPAPRNNQEWNISQMPKAPAKEGTFAAPELMIPITCNQHPWMKMYLNVVSNTFFAVSDEKGNFKISGLPPGEYTLEAVHEQLGTQQVKVTIAPRETKQISLSFRAAP